MRFIIVGCGRVGSNLAKLLVTDKHDVTVVDENPAAFRRLGNRFPGAVEVGTGIDYDVLKRAGAEAADAFVTVTDGDNRNIMAALIAQRMFAIRRVVARIYDPPRGELYRELGIETFCPTTIGAQIIYERLTRPETLERRLFDYGVLSTLGATVRAAEAGRRVEEIEREGLIRVTAIRRGEVVSVAKPSDVLRELDEIGAVVAPAALADFARMFGLAQPELVAV